MLSVRLTGSVSPTLEDLSVKGFGLVSERTVSRSTRSGHWAGPVVISACKPDYEIAADTPRSPIDQYVRPRRGQLSIHAARAAAPVAT